MRSKFKKTPVRRTRRRTTRVPRSVGAIQSMPHTFVRTFVNNDALTSLATVNYIAAGAENQLSQLPNSSEFTALFDQYKIKKVEWTYMPRFDNVEVNTSIATPMPRIYTVIDRDDSSTPLTLNQMLQYADVKSTAFNKPVKVTYTPSLAASVYAGVTSGYSPKSNQWIDISVPSVSHYGHKVWIDLHGTGYGNNFKVDTMCRVTFQCKNLR